MKRMYVDGRFRGQRRRRRADRAAIADARRLGYRRMLLDTSIRQAEALGLYARYGFTPIEPYYEVAPELREWLTFMALDLRERCARPLTTDRAARPRCPSRAVPRRPCA